MMTRLQARFTVLSVLLPTLVIGRGVDIGICGPKITDCTCGNGEKFQVTEKQCTFIHKWRPQCHTCVERTDEQLCAKFQHCHECESGAPERCATCPPGKYGAWCNLDCQCQNGGACSRDGECTCRPNFAGRLCEISLDPPGICPRPSAVQPDGNWDIFGDKGGDLVAAGALLKYTCHPGFELQGESTLTCILDGTWSSPFPQCIPKPKDCPVVEPVLGGRVTVFLPSDDHSHFIKLNEQLADSLLGPFKQNTQLIYRCDSNFYTLIGAANRTCSSTGHWSGQAPTCLPTCGRSSAPRTPFLTHGQPSEIGQWPWQVALAVNSGSQWEIWCGGSLINERWVVTAAHCVHFPNTKTMLNIDQMRLYFGKYFRSDDKDDKEVQMRQVEQVTVHPDFNFVTLDADVALVRVTVVHFSSRIQPVCLPDPRTDDSDLRLVKDSLGIVSGWGTKEDGNASSVLQYIQVPVVPTQDCRDAYKEVNISVTLTKNMFCAGHEEGERDVCGGDSGGPLVFPLDKSIKDRWVLEGVVSWGSINGCGHEKQYGAYVRVNNYVDWIKHNAG